MAAQKKAKAPEPAGESAPMWIVSFADLVTLLMSFFVVLYALKQGGAKQQMDTAAAIKATFDPSYMPAADAPPEWQEAMRRAHGLPGPPYVNTGGKATKPTQGADGSHPQVETIREGKAVNGGKITFNLVESNLDEPSLETLRQIAEQVKGLNNVLMVKGHVSSDEINLLPDDKDGMGLSYRRALLVAKELEKLGVDHRVLRPVACGPFEPIKTGVYSTAEQRQNRRVEIFATDNTASQFAPVKTVTVGGEAEPASDLASAEKTAAHVSAQAHD